jgi:peptidoglycan/xylan/chitin deacetylase (PgdA/CDA1 family)
MSNPLSGMVPALTVADRPRVEWPDGKAVAVWVIPNIEQYRVDALEVPELPDVRGYSRRDYGNRVGIWRMFDVLSRLGIRGTVALNGEVAETYPQVVDRALELDWELMGHGMTNSTRLTHLQPDEERAVIADTRATIEKLGTRMHGWLGPGLTESWSTLDLLADAGVEYTCDWVNDDLPYAFSNGLWSMPYTLELNDMPLFSTPSISIADFERRIRDSFDVLVSEAPALPRVMSIALHPFLIGAPHRIRYLERALRYLVDSEQAWFATGHEILAHYRAATAAASPDLPLAAGQA